MVTDAEALEAGRDEGLEGNGLNVVASFDDWSTGFYMARCGLCTFPVVLCSQSQLVDFSGPLVQQTSTSPLHCISLSE